MRAARQKMRGWILYFAVPAIGAMLMAGSASAGTCVDGKTLNFVGTEKVTVTASGFKAKGQDPLFVEVVLGTKKFTSSDEEGNFYSGKFKKAVDFNYKKLLESVEKKAKAKAPAGDR